MKRASAGLAAALARRLCNPARPASSLSLDSSAPAALVYATHGPPESVLNLAPQGPASTPPPPGTARVRWLLAPLNWSDVNVVEGSYPGAAAPPATPGNEGVGVVVEVGAPTGAGHAGDALTPPLAPGDFVVPLTPGAGTWRSLGEVPTDALWRVDGVAAGGEDGAGGSGGQQRPGASGGLTLDQAATLCIK